MKLLHCCVAIVLLTMSCPSAGAQTFEPDSSGEVVKYESLLYAPRTMTRLKRIADSLQIAFRSCTPSVRYVGAEQAIVEVVRFVGDRSTMRRIRDEMKSGVLPGALMKGYRRFLERSPVTLVAHSDSTQKWSTGEMYRVYSAIPDRGGAYTIHPTNTNAARKGAWLIYDGSERTHAKPAVEGMYFLDEPRRPAIPDAYARLVQYVDCLVDTTLPPTRRPRYRVIPTADLQSLLDELDSVNRFEPRPTPPRDSTWDDAAKARYRVFAKALGSWESRRKHHWDTLYTSRADLRDLLVRAARLALAQTYSTEDLEMQVGIVNPSLALDLKRSRVVTGTCSMDDRPREHARDIAVLAADATRWDVFMRAHLDILNDRFNRITDGSYAWPLRGTYVRELEALDINVSDLLIGSALLIDNAAPTHYFGSISRMGRAAAEARGGAEFENRVLSIIADSSLDAVNRARVLLLCVSYMHYLDDARYGVCAARFRSLAPTLPSYLSTYIERRSWERRR